jgi:hypothetical protein
MEQHVAVEHLQVIRTLMERSALYRRTLAPIMLAIGAVGCLAAVGGIALGLDRLPTFCGWWLSAAVVAVAATFSIARRQALQDGERFWSPPALRVTQALLPPLAAGLLLTLALVAYAPEDLRPLFVLGNGLFYACAAHAAGFFMPRGMKLFGWLMICAVAVASLVRPAIGPGAWIDHALMGALFGAAHLAYGSYLFLTERRKSAA